MYISEIMKRRWKQNRIQEAIKKTISYYNHKKRLIIIIHIVDQDWFSVPKLDKYSNFPRQIEKHNRRQR